MYFENSSIVSVCFFSSVLYAVGQLQPHLGHAYTVKLEKLCLFPRRLMP